MINGYIQAQSEQRAKSSLSTFPPKTFRLSDIPRRITMRSLNNYTLMFCRVQGDMIEVLDRIRHSASISRNDKISIGQFNQSSSKNEWNHEKKKCWPYRHFEQTDLFFAMNYENAWLQSAVVFQL